MHPAKEVRSLSLFGCIRSLVATCRPDMDRTCVPCIYRQVQSLNHWTTREVPNLVILEAPLNDRPLTTVHKTVCVSIQHSLSTCSMVRLTGPWGIRRRSYLDQMKGFLRKPQDQKLRRTRLWWGEGQLYHSHPTEIPTS